MKPKNQRDLAHYWANTEKPGYMRVANIIVDNDVIYSYGGHFAIARKHPTQPMCALITERTYSRTTSKHIRYVLQALRACEVLSVPQCDTVAPSDWIRQKVTTALSQIAGAGRRHKLWKYELLTAMHKLHTALRIHALFPGSPAPIEFFPQPVKTLSDLFDERLTLRAVKDVMTEGISLPELPAELLTA